MKKIKLGVIGCGMAGLRHIKCFNEIDGVTISHVYDTSLFNALEAARLSNGKAASNIEEIFSNPEIDGVVIATPPNTHIKLAIKAILSKKHVLIEKPLAINEQELNDFERAIQNVDDLIIMDCSVRHSRLNEKFDYIKRILATKKIGEIYAISHITLQKNSRPGVEYNPEAKWFLDKKISGGGPIVDWGCYDLSFYTGLLGDSYDFSCVSAYCTNGLEGKSFKDVEEHFFINLIGTRKSSPNGKILLSLERATHANIESTVHTIRFYGTKGSVLLGGYPHWESNKVTFYTNNDDHVDTRMFYTKHDDYYDFFLLDLHFVECILKKSSPKLNIDYSIKNMRLLLQCQQSFVWHHE